MGRTKWGPVNRKRLCRLQEKLKRTVTEEEFKPLMARRRGWKPGFHKVQADFLAREEISEGDLRQFINDSKAYMEPIA